MRLKRCGAAAVDALAALRVEPQPAEAAPEVVLRDGGEALLGVQVHDPLPRVERVVSGLELFVVVQRRPVAQGPLALGTGGMPGARTLGGGGHLVLDCSGPGAAQRSWRRELPHALG